CAERFSTQAVQYRFPVAILSLTCALNIESARMPRRKSHRVAKRGKGGARKRDYATEYARRISRGLAGGLSRSQARGHPKPGESAISLRRGPATLEDDRLQRGLRILRQEKNLRVAARTIGVSPERLKHAAAAKGAIIKERRRWVVNPDLPRR